MNITMITGRRYLTCTLVYGGKGLEGKSQSKSSSGSAALNQIDGMRVYINFSPFPSTPVLSNIQVNPFMPKYGMSRSKNGSF